MAFSTGFGIHLRLLSRTHFPYIFTMNDKSYRDKHILGGADK